ncbi:MAG TPA: MAPEG family protein [Allosphingosinicella sp.]|nr:MAPEG family protein [Allosphingosinicella sp.]
MILPITLTLAGAAAILLIWLAGRVSRVRRQFRIGLGDGGNEALLRRIRAHGNYVENMPIVLILIGLIELAGGDRRILWAAGIAFILARIAHAFGMDRPSPSRLRMVGMGMNALILVGLAGWALSFAYRMPPASPQPHEIMIGPGRTA